MRVLGLAVVLFTGVAAEYDPAFGEDSDSAARFSAEVSAAHKRDEEDKAAAVSDARVRLRAQQRASKTTAKVDDLAEALGLPPSKFSAHGDRRMAARAPAEWVNSAEALRMENEMRSAKPHTSHKKAVHRFEASGPRQAAKEEEVQELVVHTSTTTAPRVEKVEGMVRDLGDATGVERKVPAQWVPSALHPARPKNPDVGKLRMPTIAEEKQHAAALKLKVPQSHGHRLTTSERHSVETPIARLAEVSKAAAPVVAVSQRTAPAAVTFNPRTRSWVPVAETTPDASSADTQPLTMRADPRALKKGCHWGDIFC